MTPADAPASGMFDDDDLRAPAGKRERFGGRWRLVGAGVSDVWKYGDLLLEAPSGRLLLRGPNGTGKTTALEALWPYLLDLNAQRLSAGKARTTTLKSLMREGASGKRRIGYLWLTLAGPGSDGEWSYGVRLQYSESTPVKVVPFCVPGRPLRDIELHGPSRASLNLDEFSENVQGAGGQVFDDEDAYVSNLAARIWSAKPSAMSDLATRLRVVRNPSLLGDLSAAAAAEALRDALPTVSDDVVAATAEALAESEATREAFQRDAQDAEVLREFAETWTGHITDVVRRAHEHAVAAGREVRNAANELHRLGNEHQAKLSEHDEAKNHLAQLIEQLQQLAARKSALEQSAAFTAAHDLANLRRARDAMSQRADAALDALRTRATAESERSHRLVTDLERSKQALTHLIRDAAAGDPAAVPASIPLSWTVKPRGVLRVGEVHVDSGPDVAVACDLDELRELARAWGELATAHRTRGQDAELAHGDHARTVVPAEQARDQAARESRSAEAEADRTLQRQRTTERAARDATADWCAATLGWLPDAFQERLTAIRSGSHTLNDVDSWGREDIEALAAAEPGQVLRQALDWQEEVREVAAARTATLEAAAHSEREQAAARAAQAQELRAQASRLRSGELLPLPRPSWVRELYNRRSADTASAASVSSTHFQSQADVFAPDSALLGSALAWAKDGELAGIDQALLESALAASGLLGAAMDGSGAHSYDWTVRATGPALPESGSLAGVLTVDDEHPSAAVARAVLSRVPLLDTAVLPVPSTETPSPTVRTAPAGGLVIGRDGTFASGPIIGYAPGARDRAETPPATHVGARQRRAAALARADRLDDEAAEVDAARAKHLKQATQYEIEARHVARVARGFPSPGELQHRESARSLATDSADQARELARQRAQEAAEAIELSATMHDEWAERTRARQLPTTISELSAVSTSAQHAATCLGGAADRLLGRFLTEVTHFLDQTGSPTARGSLTSETADLKAVWGKATNAHQEACTAQEEYSTLERTAGAEAQAVLAEHAEVRRSLEARGIEEEPARQRVSDLLVEATTLGTKVEAAGRRLSDAEPAADAAKMTLIQLLQVPGVSDALAPPGPPARRSDAGDETADDQIGTPDRPTTGTADAGQQWWVANPVGSVGDALRGRRTITVRTLRERYDQARAHLAGTWTLDPGDLIGGLDTFTLTHDEISYHPLAAARRAETLRERARAALDAAEEQALRDFIIGRLPTAIGLAWTYLHDWVHTINHLMRNAAASSGVGVQVRIRLSSDLSPATRTVHQLACTVADADRTGEQSREVGQALAQLIAGATGDTMYERIAEAVDVRGWVDIHYEIDRGTGRSERWGSRTALSGGERRLVVLAPMLAAVAAGYDALGPTSLRLAALDEVPAEVDERGREGLARFMAELDLDLIATSYLWDGAPGAWDGIDAHDLEAGSDGTVVAFEMLVRGLTDLPGDDVVDLPTGRHDLAIETDHP